MHDSALESPASQLSAIDRLVNAADRLEDRRDNQRFPCFVPVEIVGGNIPAGRWFFAREISRNGIGLVPEDRKQQALFLSLAIKTNLSMAAHDRISRWGVFIDQRKAGALVDEYQKRLNIRMASPDQLVGNLSGGNQQKVVLARWLALGPKVLIVDEPTRGIDVGAKVEVHNLLFQMADAGIAVIAISSELSEILAISDRIVTMREGRVTGEIRGSDADQERLMTMMTAEIDRAA